jgi:hypothetical protein
MIINTDKTNLIRFKKGRNIILNHYCIMGKTLREANSCKYLGVVLSRDLQWGPHIDSTATKAHKVLRFLMRTLGKSCTSTKDFAFKTFVRPILEYGGSVWDPYVGQDIKKLSKVQRLAARFVTGNFKRKSSVTEMMKVLRWESLELRRKKARLKGMFKSYVGDPAWVDIRNRIKK